MGHWDEAFFHGINKGWSSPFLDVIFVFFSQATLHGVIRAVLALVVVGLMIRRPNLRAPLGIAIIAFLLANGVSDLIKSGLPMNRPLSNGIPVHLVYDYLVKQKEIVLTSSGTMSAHAGNTAAVAAALVTFFGKRSLVFVLIALLTGLSRIYVGAHYPSQVLLGWMIGGLLGWGVAFGYLRIRAQRTQNG